MVVAVQGHDVEHAGVVDDRVAVRAGEWRRRRHERRAAVVRGPDAEPARALAVHHVEHVLAGREERRTERAAVVGLCGMRRAPRDAVARDRELDRLGVAPRCIELLLTAAPVPCASTTSWPVAVGASGANATPCGVVTSATNPASRIAPLGSVPVAQARLAERGIVERGARAVLRDDRGEVRQRARVPVAIAHVALVAAAIGVARAARHADGAEPPGLDTGPVARVAARRAVAAGQREAGEREPHSWWPCRLPRARAAAVARPRRLAPLCISPGRRIHDGCRCGARARDQ